MRTRDGILAAALMLATASTVAAGGPGMREEWVAIRDQAFAAADADGDQALTPEELETFHELVRQEMTARRFARLDADGNGVVTADELAAAPHKRGGGCPGPSGR